MTDVSTVCVLGIIRVKITCVLPVLYWSPIFNSDYLIINWSMLPALLMYKLRTERINYITSVKRHHGTTVNHQTAPCKGIQDSLAFWIPCDGFRIPRYWIPILCQGNLDSGSNPVVGFWNPWAVFLIRKSRIPDSTNTKFPDCGIRIPLHGVSQS